MPEFWQFPTVSLGIGAITSIYQARFMKYLEARGDRRDRRAARCGRSSATARWTSPRRWASIGMAGREQLDNLIWVVNCNLQRLDGPVRGNGKIIQELEADFRGAGWNVIKVIWGSRWDPLLAEDTDGRLVKVMEECVDGEYQTFKSRDGAYVREHFFGRDPVLLERVSHMSDEEIWLLNRGGLDQQKVYAAYHEAVQHTGQPTVILAKTIKGYGMGVSGEGQMITHQAKKMTEDALLAFRDRFELPLSDEQVRAAEYYKPPEDSPEMQYLRERRAALGGSLPVRGGRRPSRSRCPPLETFKGQLEGTGEREISTTMAFVRVLAALLRDKQIGHHIVPIVPDESRTFGMEGMFRQVGIYSPVGQLYQPQDSEQLMFYKEDKHGQILEEGITEAGSISSFIAAGHLLQRPRRPDGAVLHLLLDVRLPAGRRPRVGGRRLAHARVHARRHRRADDAERRGAPARGRPQPRAVLGRAELPRLRPRVRLRGRGDHPGRPAADGRRAGGRLLLPHADERELPPPGDARGRRRRESCAGCTCCAGPGRSTAQAGPRVQLLGSGTILSEVLAAAELLESDFGVAADVWSVTSFTELRRDGIEVERWNMLHPLEEPRRAYVTEQLGSREGPVVASTDYIRAFADQIRQWVPGRYRVLGTDGFGRSDSRQALRRFFEVDRHYVAVAALKELADEGAIDRERVKEAIERYEIDAEAPMPTTV